MVKAFFYGVASALLSFCISIPFEKMGVFVSNYTTVKEAVQTAFFAAAIPEEVAKYIMLWLFLRKCKYFDQRMDGIVYAVCVSLGFAALENVFYLIGNYDNWMSVGISRALTAVPGHFGFGVLMGYYYSLVKFNDDRKFRSLVLIAPVLAHTAFNTVLFVMDLTPVLYSVLEMGFVLICVGLWRNGNKKIAAHIAADKEVMGADGVVEVDGGNLAGNVGEGVKNDGGIDENLIEN
jgi:RsiW-degrading membrane proteinase PrsW (M82 family)